MMNAYTSVVVERVMIAQDEQGMDMDDRIYLMKGCLGMRPR